MAFKERSYKKSFTQRWKVEFYRKFWKIENCCPDCNLEVVQNI